MRIILIGEVWMWVEYFEMNGTKRAEIVWSFTASGRGHNG